MESMHNQYIYRQNQATMSNGGRREENDPSLISVLLCFIAPESQVRWQRQWTQYYLFWNSEKDCVCGSLGHWLTHIPILPRRPLWARFSHASNLTFHLTRAYSPIMHCWNNVSFISVAIDLLVFFVYTRIPFAFEWEVLEVGYWAWKHQG